MLEELIDLNYVFQEGKGSRKKSLVPKAVLEFLSVR